MKKLEECWIHMKLIRKINEKIGRIREKDEQARIDRQERISELEASLGGSLVERIQDTTSKYMDRFGFAGMAIGALGGGIGSYFLHPWFINQPANNPNTPLGMNIFFGAFLGLYLCLNIGGVTGLIYGERKAANLSYEFPEKQDEIREYTKIDGSCVAGRVRGFPE